MATKIFFGNHKGGVGKTTTTFQIGINMAEKYGKNVLLLDLDPQASLSKIFINFIHTPLNQIPVEQTFNFLLQVYILHFRKYSKYDILEGSTYGKPNLVQNAVFSHKVKSTHNASFSFIPSRMDIPNSRINDIAEETSRYSMGIIGISKLIEDIENSVENLEYLLIDCPPSLNSVIHAAFLKSDYYIIPTIADDISAAGVADYINEIQKTILKYTYDSSVGGLLLEKIFSKPPNLVGILETLHMEISKTASNSVLANLNRQLEELNVPTIPYAKKYMISDFGTQMREKPRRQYIFENKIRKLDNKSVSNDYGIPYKTRDGRSHEEYNTITQQIIDICENFSQ